MRISKPCLAGGLVAAIAGCTARADADRRAADEPGEVRVRFDKDTVQAVLAPARQITVVGTARASVAPDLADVSIGVTTSRPTAPEAVATNNRAMTDLIEAIKKQGIAARDIQTSQVSITPQYSRPPEPKPDFPPEATAPKVVGYEVSNTVRVTARDPARLGDLIDAATRAGSNQVYGISFRVNDREAVTEGLRPKAFDAAKAKAELYARRAGMVLGPVLQIAEYDTGSAPPFQAPMMSPMMAPAPMAPGMPVNAGQEEASLSVSVIFELKSPR